MIKSKGHEASFEALLSLTEHLLSVGAQLSISFSLLLFSAADAELVILFYVKKIHLGRRSLMLLICLSVCGRGSVLCGFCSPCGNKSSASVIYSVSCVQKYVLLSLLVIIIAQTVVSRHSEAVAAVHMTLFNEMQAQNTFMLKIVFHTVVLYVESQRGLTEYLSSVVQGFQNNKH